MIKLFPALRGQMKRALHLASGAALPLPGRSSAQLAKNAVAGADLNYDFKTDIAIATPSGLKIYQQQDPHSFRDITEESKISTAIAAASYTGVWAFDIDLDGDLDLVLGTPQGDPLVLRNNGDGTFSPIHPFQGVDGLMAFTAADIDGDGDPDVALLDRNGSLKVFLNERLGKYRGIDVPVNLRQGVVALSAADINGDGILDFVLLKNDSSVVRLSQNEESGQVGFC